MRHFSKEKLIKFIVAMLGKAGISADDAKIAAEVLIQSDASGVFSHGLSRLPMYLDRIGLGLVNTKPQYKVLAEIGGTVLVDCDNGLGIVTMPKIMDMLMEKTKKQGVVAAAMRRSNHFGVGNYYALKAAQNNMILIMTTSTTPCMAPTGGVDLLLGTNPITVGVPGGKEKPIILDMATSNVAMGKLQAALREGKKIPLGWAITKEGKPTEDPAEGVVGSLLPVGGYKGYGLAVIVDIFSALLSGAAFGHDIGRVVGYDVPKTEDIGHFMLLIDVTKFRPAEEFQKDADKYVRVMKDSKKADGVKEIFLPGEIEQKMMDENAKAGVPLAPALVEQLLGMAKTMGVAGSDDSFDSMLDKF